MTSQLKISVVVPTYNRVELLTRTLGTLLCQEFPHDQYEVIVVNDGSTDRTAGFLAGLETPNLRCLEQNNRGLPAARNAGLNAARGELVLFIDDDIICSPGLLRAHVQAHRGGPSVVLGPVFLARESPFTLASSLDEQGWAEANARRLAGEQPRFPQDASLGNNASAPRALLLECGGYDERFKYLQDIDLGLTVWKKGVPFCYAPQAVGHHYYVKSLRNLLRKDASGQARSQLLLCRKHPEFRPCSRLALLGEGSLVKRCLREICSRLPLDLPAEAALAGIEHLRALAPARKAGMRLLGTAVNAAIYRNAAREAGSWANLRTEFGLRLPVLMYHSVAASQSGPPGSVPAEQFERQIRWLARSGYRGITAADWAAWRREARPIPSKPVLITFEGASAGVAKYALPVLERHGLRATVFAVTRRIAARNGHSDAADEQYHMMSEEQIRRWVEKGMEFGSLGRTGRDLTAMAAGELEAEVAGSAADLAAIVGAPATSFAYPEGRYNEAVSNCVRRSYIQAFTRNDGINTLAGDAYELRRTEILPRAGTYGLAWRLRFSPPPSPASWTAARGYSESAS